MLEQELLNQANQQANQRIMINFRLLQNRYQTTAILSECGGFGITYRAVDKLCFDQPCVVKQLRMTEADQQTLPILRQMFEIEQISPALPHPRVAGGG